MGKTTGVKKIKILRPLQPAKGRDSDKHCWDCAYNVKTPEEIYSKCVRDFNSIELPVVHSLEFKRKKSIFPFSFDPLWLGPCKGFSTYKTEIRKEDEFETIMRNNL